jgi:tRNA uridine 5-carboxymethylaminomethyl modification enzyme
MSLAWWGPERWRAFEEKQRAITVLHERLGQVRLQPGSELAEQLAAITGERLSRDQTLMDYLKRPGVTMAALSRVLDLGEADAVVRSQVEVELKYAGYMARQDEDIARVRRHETMELPADLDYAQIPGLSSELRQKLEALRPATLAHAGRIPGMTPAALSVLLVHTRKDQRPRQAAFPGPDHAVRA